MAPGPEGELARNRPDHPSLNPVIKELLEAGEFFHRGKRYPIAHSTSADICRRYADLIVEQGLKCGLEIGTLFGFSTLFLGDAFARTGGRLDTVDIRYAKRTWSNGEEIEDIHEVAERLVERAGFADLVTFRVGNSNEVLPQLIEAGAEYDFGLIDGSHRFEVALLDFICLDRMLAVDGYVAIDDVGANVSAKEGLAGGPNRLLNTIFTAGRYQVEPWSANVVVCRKLRDA